MEDEISYRVMIEDDTDAVKKLLYESFFNEEPLGRSLNMTSNECSPYVEALTERVGKDGVSIIAVCSRTGEIIGCRLSVLETEDKKFKIPLNENDPQHRKIGVIIKFLSFLGDGVDIFKKYDVHTFLHFQALNVQQKYSGRGIGKRLVEESIKLAKSLGLRLVVAEVTGKFSQRVYEKLSFDTLTKVEYDDYLDDSGERIFGDMGVHTSGKLVAKFF